MSIRLFEQSLSLPNQSCESRGYILCPLIEVCRLVHLNFLPLLKTLSLADLSECVSVLQTQVNKECRSVCTAYLQSTSLACLRSSSSFLYISVSFSHAEFVAQLELWLFAFRTLEPSIVVRVSRERLLHRLTIQDPFMPTKPFHF